MKFSLGAVSTLRSTNELEEQLRKRLRFVALCAAAVAAATVVVGAGALGERLFDAPGKLFTSSPYYGFIPVDLVLLLGLSVALSPKRRLGLSRLRWCEWALFGPIGVFYAVAFTSQLETQLTAVPQFWLIVALGHAVSWVIGLMVYAMLIPNSWRRCAGALGLTLFCALLPDATVVVASSRIPDGVGWLFLAAKAITLIGSVAIGVYGAYRIEVLQQDALAARKLGQYVLKERLGEGGMGQVYLAEHQFLRRPCAVKLIRPEQLGEPGVVARFEREVQVTATLTHPNTIQIFDYGHTDDGTFYYAMELLPGLSLEQMVDLDGRLPPARAIHFLAQVCGALREAHGLGLIHRDIKPSNVIVGERGGKHDVAKLLDFGLVAPVSAGAADPKLTQAGLIVGTPAFMSPEQCGGEELGPASDIYSVGALGYYLLTGKALFAGRSLPQMLAAHMYEPPKPMADAGASPPPELEALIVRCLAKRPDDRFSDAASLEAALHLCAESAPWSEADANEWWARRKSTKPLASDSSDSTVLSFPP